MQMEEVEGKQGLHLRRMAAFTQSRLLSNPSPIYGEGFREAEQVFAALQQGGASTRAVLSKMLTHISIHAALPIDRQAPVHACENRSWWQLYNDKMAKIYT
jgi:hypothetical protein